jgi:hypothetical protein
VRDAVFVPKLVHGAARKLGDCPLSLALFSAGSVRLLDEVCTISVLISESTDMVQWA